MDEDWYVVKKRRNSDWQHIVGADMTEADAKAMAVNMNRVNPDALTHYFVALKEEDEK